MFFNVCYGCGCCAASSCCVCVFESLGSDRQRCYECARICFVKTTLISCTKTLWRQSAVCTQSACCTQSCSPVLLEFQRTDWRQMRKREEHEVDGGISKSQECLRPRRCHPCLFVIVNARRIRLCAMAAIFCSLLFQVFVVVFLSRNAKDANTNVFVCWTIWQKWMCFVSTVELCSAHEKLRLIFTACETLALILCHLTANDGKCVCHGKIGNGENFKTRKRRNLCYLISFKLCWSS